MSSRQFAPRWTAPRCASGAPTLARWVQSLAGMHTPHSSDGLTQSPWTDDAKIPDTEVLVRNTGAEVCVVGAGIAGLSIAYELACDGRSVVVIDAADIASGQTARTSAHLASALDDRFVRLERLHGLEGARLAAESHRMAIDRIEAIVHRERIDCDFARVDGYLFADPAHQTEYLAEEMQAALRAGLPAYAAARAPLSFDTGPCIRFPDQATFHPLRYASGLMRAIIERGGRIHHGTRAVEVHGGEEAHVITERGHSITAHAIVVATNVPINDRAVIHTKQAAYRTYTIAAEVPAGTLPPGLFWDTAEPYHYVRSTRGEHGDLLLIGGEDHKTGQESEPELRWLRLADWGRAHFGELGPIRHRWSGQVIEPVDGLAFIGKNPLDADNVYVATGDSGHGLTHGVIAGMILRELVQSRSHPWASLYDPRRRSLRAVAEYAKENLNTAAQYADWLKGGEREDIEHIPRGEGAVVRRGAQLLAVYVDLAGVASACSAACPHLGGVVHWNRAEKTWDCPCHGSRFSRFGEVVEGPACTPLERADIGEPGESSPDPIVARPLPSSR